MDRMKLLVFLSLASSLIAGVSGETMIVESGSSATLPCTTDEVKMCILIKDGTTILNRDYPITEKFSIKNTSNCLIEARNLNISDSGSYSCQFGNELPKTEKKTFNLTVTVTPQAPELFYNGQRILNTEGNIVNPDVEGNVEFTCEAKRGYPKFNISWQLDDQPTESREEAVEIDGLFDVTSTVKVHFPPHINNDVNKEKEVKCVVEHPTSNAAFTAKFGRTYPVQEAWINNGESSSYSMNPEEGVNLTCSGNGLPKPENFAFEKFENEEWKKFANERTIEVKETGMFRCLASNNLDVWKESDPVEIKEYGITPQRESRQEVSAVIGIVVGTIALIVIVFVVVIVLYRKEKACFKRSTPLNQQPPTQGNVENGMKNAYDNELTNIDKDLGKVEPVKDGVNSTPNHQ